jgi:DNA-binding beta-propeller fold protein YncE
VRVFDLNGKPQETLGVRGHESAGFNYPTFATARGGVLYVNDTLNYRVKLFGSDGSTGSIGQEGDGPGAFARPKGVAVDGDGNIFVVDGLFDNVQVFDREGRLLLVIGSAGNDAGEFWSPAGIHIDGDYIYIADTFNHRIQILREIGS